MKHQECCHSGGNWSSKIGKESYHNVQNLIRDSTIADSPHSPLHLLAPLPFSHPSGWSSCQFSFHEAPRVLLLWRKLIIKDWKRELSWCIRPYMGCHRNIYDRMFLFPRQQISSFFLKGALITCREVVPTVEPSCGTTHSYSQSSHSLFTAFFLSPLSAHHP